MSFFCGDDIYSSVDIVLLPLDVFSDGDSADEDGERTQNLENHLFSAFLLNEAKVRLHNYVNIDHYVFDNDDIMGGGSIEVKLQTVLLVPKQKIEEAK